MMRFNPLSVPVAGVAALFLACAPTPPPPDGATGIDDSEPALIGCFNRATEAIEREDWAAARDALADGIALEPELPALRLHAARAEAELGDRESCLAQLEALDALGATADLSAEGAFAGLRGDPDFERVAGRLRDNGEPPGSAEIVHRFADAELWPEGIARDPDTGSLYVGSIHRRAIVRLDPDGALHSIGNPDEDALMEVLGLWVDNPRRALWAVTGAGDYEPPIDGTPRVNELVRFDLDNGRIAARYPVPDDELRLINDVTVAPDGTAWVTETLRGELYRVPPGGSLELFRRYPDLVYLNGIAVSDDGTRLYLGHYGGLSLVSPTDGSIRRVRGPEMALGMIDGLSWVGNRLVMVQNSRYLGFRVVRVDLSPGGDLATALDVLPFGLPAGLIPYTCAVGDDTVWVIAGPPFELMETPEPPPAPAVVSMPLVPGGRSTVS